MLYFFMRDNKIDFIVGMNLLYIVSEFVKIVLYYSVISGFL